MPTCSVSVKILVITPFPPLKAPEADHAIHLCTRLADRGLDVHVATMMGSIAPNYPRLTVHPIARDWSWWDLPRLAMYMRRCAPDVILLMYLDWVYNYHPMITFAPTISRALLPGVRFVTLFEDGNGARPGETSLLARALRKGLARWAGPEDVDYGFGTLLRDSDRIIVVSDRTRATLAERSTAVNGNSVLIPPPPIICMRPQGHDTDRRHRREILGVKTDDFLMVYFGYVYPAKGLDTLLKAFTLVRNKRSNVRLIIVGGTIVFPQRPFYMEEMRDLTKELGIEGSVTYTGGYAWDSDEASGYLHASDLCVLPFDRGVSVHNSSFSCACAHGLPIITTRGEMLELQFVHQENVFLCPPKNPGAMAAAIEAVMDSPALQRRLRAGALELAREWFSWDRAIDQTIGALVGLV